MANVRINQQFFNTMEKTARDRLDKYAAFLVNDIKRRLSAGRRGSIGTMGIRDGEPPHVDIGELRNSIKKLRKEGDPNAIIVGSIVVYSWLQEMGGTVRPRNGKFLAIPLSKEAKRWQNGGNSARTFACPNMATIHTKRGSTLIVQKQRNKFIIHYLLTTHATIAPHPFIRPAVNETHGDFARIMGGG